MFGGYWIRNLDEILFYGFWIFIFDFGAMLGLNGRETPGASPLDKIGQHAECAAIVS